MDSALRLKIQIDQDPAPTPAEIDRQLGESELVRRLTAEFIPRPLYAVWRLIALSEIPYAQTLAYTRVVRDYIAGRLCSGQGFSLSGRAADLLPCYNAMLAEAFCKLGQAQSEPARQAIQWIVAYQPFTRGAGSAWTGQGAQKYGGCLKSTPCYIGAAKAAKALHAYRQAGGRSEAGVEERLERGMEYLLEHRLYQRHSDGRPITSHLLEIAYPPSYHLNIIELLELAYGMGRMSDPRVQDAVDYVKSLRTPTGHWKTSYIYNAQGYQSFDRRGRPAEWASYLLERCLA